MNALGDPEHNIIQTPSSEKAQSESSLLWVLSFKKIK